MPRAGHYCTYTVHVPASGVPYVPRTVARQAGRTLFLGVDGNGHFTPVLEPTAFVVTAASDAAGGAPSHLHPNHLGPPAPPVLELSHEMKAAFVRDGYLHLPG